MIDYIYYMVEYSLVYRGGGTLYGSGYLPRLPTSSCHPFIAE